MASPSCPFRTSDPFAARQHALQWAYATWQDAVILLDEGQLLVLIGPHERCVSPEVRAYLKTALDTGVEPPDGLPPRCIVIATSNDVAKIEPALLERFRVLNFSAGPCFAEACQERLGAIWEAEAPGRDLPPSWLTWGWQEAGNSLRFSMRVALRTMEDYLG
jgi:hypothetical protein